MIRLAACIGTLLALTPPALAEDDFILVDRPLSDRDFYRLVACEAPPGGACAWPFVRWPVQEDAPVDIAITRWDPGYPADLRDRAEEALVQAVDEINGLDAGIALRIDDRAPGIRVLLMDHPPQTALRGTGVPGLDGNWLDAAYVHVWWNERDEITRAAIVLTPSIGPVDIRSVLLEEVVQSLGLLTDIAGPAYAGRSIFAQDDNDTTRLRGQDAMAVRRHYGG